MDDAIIEAYSGQSGGSLPFFAGGVNQWGGGILGTIARFAFPILKRVIGTATNTAEDVIVRKNFFKDSIIKNAVSEVGNFIGGGGGAGGAKKRKSPTTTTINRNKDVLSSKKLK